MATDFIAKKDWPVYSSGSRLNLAGIIIEEKMNRLWATFDLFVRDAPACRNYLVFFGLEQIVEYLQDFKMNESHLRWMKNTYHFSDKVIGYFRNFKFTGDLFAMPEGSIFFSGEPVLKITAPISEAEYVEMFIITTVFHLSVFGSKMSRVIDEANGKRVVVGYNRSYGQEAALRSERIKHILGAQAGLVAYDYKHERHPFSVGTYHFFIKLFNSELEAFRTYLKHTKGKGFVLVDTYDTISGIRNYIKAIKELGFEKEADGIQLDSGDMLELSRQARKMLDRAGMKNAKVFAMGNLDEYKIHELEKNQAPIDVYAGTTDIVTPSDAPILEVVYKLSEIKDGQKVFPKMKLSKEKISLPGSKNIYRVEKNGRYAKDIIGLEGEKVAGKRMLKQYIKNGKLIAKMPKLEEIKEYIRQEKKKFPKGMFDIGRRFNYPVKISPKLGKLIKKTKQELEVEIRKQS